MKSYNTQYNTDLYRRGITAVQVVGTCSSTGKGAPKPSSSSVSVDQNSPGSSPCVKSG